MSGTKNPRRAYVFGLLTVGLWSTVASAFKLTLEHLGPARLVLAASIASLLTLGLVLAARGRLGNALATLPRHLARSLAMGALNPLLYYAVLFEAYDRLPAQIAQPLNYTWAITLALLAVPVLGQPLNRQLAIGIGVGYLGVLLLLTQGRFDAWPSLDWPGVGLALGSTVLWAGYWLANARVDVPPVTLMAWSFVLASPLVLAACLSGPGWPTLTGERLAYGAWVGLVEMGVTFLLWQQAMRRTRQAGRIGQLIFLSPFLSLVLIGTVVGESIHWTSAAGLGVIVLGLWLSRRGSADS